MGLAETHIPRPSTHQILGFARPRTTISPRQAMLSWLQLYPSQWPAGVSARLSPHQATGTCSHRHGDCNSTTQVMTLRTTSFNRAKVRCIILGMSTGKRSL